MTVGDRIRYRRIELNMSQDELAAKAGYCSKPAISRFEHSGNDISMKQIKRLAEALDCSMAYLMGWEDNSPDKEIPERKKPEEKPIEEKNADGMFSTADISKAMDLYEKYQNASPEVRAAIGVLLKSPQSDV